jgi:hypothetical protein
MMYDNDINNDKLQFSISNILTMMDDHDADYDDEDK